MKNQTLNCFCAKARTCFNIVLFFLIPFFSHAFNVNITNPTGGAGACQENVFTLSFTGVAIGTQITMTPTLVFAGSSCNTTTQGIYYASGTASPSNGITVTDTVGIFKFTVGNTGNVTATFKCYIDCHIVGSSNVNLIQAFTASPGPVTLNGGTDSSFTSYGIKKPEIALIPTVNYKAPYLTNGFMYFYYKNNIDRASIRFTFNADSTYCGQITTNGIFYQKGLNGNQTTYTNSLADTLTLNNNDTLVIKQRITTQICINPNPLNCTGKATLKWQCNYPIAVQDTFCKSCFHNDTAKYNITTNDIATADVIRLSPNNAVREFSCFNDTANAVEWSYAIVNKGMDAMDSLTFNLEQAGGSANSLNFLSLIRKGSIQIRTSLNHLCTVDTALTLRTAWLCTGLVDTAIYNCKVRIHNFAPTDTVFFRFETIRCSDENNSALLNTPKAFSQWQFKDFKSKSKCSTVTNQSGSGLVSGAAVSGQDAGVSGGFDFDLLLNYFPSVSNLSVAQSGIGDSATFIMDLKGLVPSANRRNVYQLLGCDTTQGFCDTLHGWLRATILCDTNIRIQDAANDVRLFKIKANNDTVYFNPEYYYTSDTVSPNICRRTFYYYYFNLADSGMRTVLENGSLEFELHACCLSNTSPTPYSVTFHLLPDPSNCFSFNYSGAAFASHLKEPDVVNNNGIAAWLPLSRKDESLNILCPGCLSPGIISNFYKMERSTLGLQDTDNDGRADSSGAKIQKGSVWFNQYGANIKTNFSGFGDRVTDYLRANFVDGDKTRGGYDYQQLTNRGLRFNVLQLSRVIPSGADTMNLTPDSLIFYVDDTTNTANGCLDCADYGMNANDFTTKFKLVATGAALTNYFLGTRLPQNEYNFAFTSYYDSVTNQYSGNLHDFPSLFSYTNNSFTGFKPGQFYRLRVVYNVCGNFAPETPPYNLGNTVKQSRIYNLFYFSGKVQTQFSGNLPQQPNTEIALNDSNYTVYPASSPPYNLVDTAFMNKYMFFCETTGAIHYFYGTVATNGSLTSNIPSGCNKYMSAIASSSIAGGKTVLDFPYEYKPALLMPVNFDMQIPIGYYVKSATERNRVIVNNNPLFSNSLPVTLTDTVGHVVIPSTSLKLLNCFTQSNSASANDTLFTGDQTNERRIDFVLAPLGCSDSLTSPLATNAATISYNVSSPACITSAVCSPASNVVTRPLQTALNKLGNLTYLAYVSSGNTSVQLNSDTVCWNAIELANRDTGQVPRSMSEHVFIAVPTSAQIPYLTSWHFVSATGTTTATGNVIGVRDTLSQGITMTGNLCAVVNNCPPDSTPVTFYMRYGENCGKYPASPFVPSSVCKVDSVQLTFTKANIGTNSPSKFHAPTYSLCDTVSVWAQFVSTQSGYIYPDSVILANLDPALEIVAAYLVNGNTSNPFSTAHSLLTATASDSLWYIHPDSLRAIGLNEAGINAGQSIYIRFLFKTGCTFETRQVLPNINLFTHDFCKVPRNMSALYSAGSFTWSNISKCTDCFTVDKIANKDTVAVGDTVTFTITVCSNNASSELIALNDLLPDTSVFTRIGTTPAFPLYIGFPADTCIDYIVKGKYRTVGSCPNGLFQNKATLQSSGATMKDSVCVNVSLPCYSPGTLVWGNNTYSDPSLLTSYSGQNIIIQDTLYVNDSLFLGNCHVYMYAGSKIIVTATGRFVLDNTIIEGCTNMWRGIFLEASSKLWVKENSVIQDANRAIEARHLSSYSITNSYIINNITGIFTPSNSSGNNIATTIFGSKFGLYRSAFKPDYPGQTAHDTIPRAGIEVYDVVMYINSPYSYMYNEFRNVNWGIYGVRSKISVEKCRFRKIYKSGYYGSATHKGSAIAMEGAISKPCELIFKDVGIGVANATIDTCVYGVYTEYTNLFIDSVNMRNVKTNGINVLRCNQSNGTSDILHSEIVASNKGVNFSNCNTGKRMRVSNCYINVNGGSKCKAVDIENTIVNSNGCVYLVDSNAIETFSGSGITGTIARNVRAYYNQVFMSLSKGSGIDLNSCDSAHVSCNYVYGHYPLQNNAAYNGKAIAVNISSYGFVSCNQMDSTWHGVEFNGSCLPTDFRGNEIQTHNIGLYMNISAVIDTQTHAGNRWWGNYTVPPFSGYGAWNENDSSFFNLAQSLFVYDPGLDTTFYPRTPFGLSGTPNNLGWFDPQVGGSTYDCIGDNYCHVLDVEGESSEGLMEAIANDENLSSEFVDETKSMAKATVFEMLKADSLQYADNEVLMDFMATTETENIGLLYEVEQEIAEADVLNSVAQEINSNADSLIRWHSQAIYVLDSIAQNDSTFTDLITRQTHIDAIAALQLNKETVIAQSGFTASLSAASSINASVYSGELPEQNEKTLNELEIIYQILGLAGVEPYFATILSIANQCPFSGGPAVYRARSFVSLFDETVEYLDSDVCLLQGIYRTGKMISEQKISDEIKVIPNPANDKIQILLTSKQDGLCSVVIEEISGKIVLQKQFDCAIKQQQFDISYLSQGIYTIRALINDSKIILTKLAVVR